ncbi:hypothetical protein HZH66_011073 [Vespula vulgaris]|uniref:Uncharacterized protein n=1 Tax=Vespula vulgaris TaxID=7454 RepID=A0A834JF84_VESVU|nr:hypothetical protein HZH66_011073 [Vespula vulgaris]
MRDPILLAAIVIENWSLYRLGPFVRDICTITWSKYIGTLHFQLMEAVKKLLTSLGISEISSAGIGADHVETSMFLSASLTLALPSPSPLASSNYEESSDPER